MAHCLVVGGTGMLRTVAIVLAEAGHRVSVVARNKERLVGLIRDTQRSPGVINPIAVDYSDRAAFEAKLREATAVLGPIAMAVVWIRSDAADSLAVVARLLGEQSDPCQVYRILGSQAADPSVTTDAHSPFDNIAGVSYRTVILGFKREHERSRWLTDDEISAGVLDAIANDRLAAVVGTVEPWDQRPR
ncbi:MAG: hypothetical protein RBT76_10880 [candidate division Zixibacteria bacterium]|nr:hypothetical protein [candidate division Zixibacteria bacterium]